VTTTSHRCPFVSDRRILILGYSEPISGVDVVPWTEVRSRATTVADYNTVIIDLLTLQTLEFSRVPHEGGLPPIEDFAHLLFSQESELIVVGNPTKFHGDRMSPWWWSPIQFEARDSSGTEVVDVDPRFAYLYRDDYHWSAYFTGTSTARRDAAKFASAVTGGGDLRLARRDPLAATRFEKPLGIEIAFAAGPKVSGPAFWLPYFAEQTSYGTIGDILRRRYGVGGRREPPAWVSDYSLPDLGPVITSIRELEAEIAKARSRLDEERRLALRVERFRELLYETGEPLEVIVCDALGALGGKVARLGSSGREDARVTDPTGRTYVIEVKGRSGALKRADVRQLAEWVLRAEEEDPKGWDGVGLLIHNSFCGEAPGRRANPYADETLHFAQRRGLSLMTTAQLFQALSDHQAGNLSVEAFWDLAAQRPGACSLPDVKVAAISSDEPSRGASNPAPAA
jgi:hypothetical protein